MTYPHLVSTLIPDGSFFQPATHREVLNRNDLGDALLPFAVIEQLMDVPAGSIADSVTGEVLECDGAQLLWLGGSLDPRIAERIGLTGQEILEHRAEDRAAILSGLSTLARVDPDGFQFLRRLVRVLVWVADPAPGKPGVTSGHSQAFPFAILIAPRALTAIPPNTIDVGPSTYLLADNLLHESVHQAITMRILHSPVLQPGYRAYEWPQIEIPWRDTSEGGKAKWPLDRALQAALVYRHLLEFRLAVLREPDLTAADREAFIDAALGSCVSLGFLATALEAHSESFGAQGQQLVAQLARDVETRTPQAQAELDAMLAKS